MKAVDLGRNEDTTHGGLLVKNKFKSYVSILMTFLLAFSVLSPLASTVVKGQEETEIDIVTPIPISEIPHESDYVSYPHLLDNGVKNAAEGGKLSVKEVDGQMTLVDEGGSLIQLRGMSTHG